MAAVEIPAVVSRTERPGWGRVFANALPLVFLSLAVMIEGFPRPPFPFAVGIA